MLPLTFPAAISDGSAQCCTCARLQGSRLRASGWGAMRKATEAATTHSLPWCSRTPPHNYVDGIHGLRRRWPTATMLVRDPLLRNDYPGAQRVAAPDAA